MRYRKPYRIFYLDSEFADGIRQYERSNNLKKSTITSIAHPNPKKPVVNG